MTEADDLQIQMGTLHAALAGAELVEHDHIHKFGGRPDPGRRADFLRDGGHFLLRAAAEAVSPERLHEWILQSGYVHDNTLPNGVRTYQKGEESVVAPSSPGCRGFSDYGRSVVRAIVDVSLFNGESAYPHLRELAGDPTKWGDGGEAEYRSLAASSEADGE